MDEQSRKEYETHRDKLQAIKEENERVLGRNTLVIAGGAFTLSVTLLKDLYTEPVFWSRWLLISSWIFFGASLLLQFFSDQLSSLAADVELQKLKGYYEEGKEKARIARNKFDQRVKRINQATPMLLVAGFICMIIFATANFIHQGGKDMAKQTKDSATREGKITASPLSPKLENTRGVTMPEIPAKPGGKGEGKK